MQITMLFGGLVFLAALSAAVVGEGVNDTLAVDDPASNLTTRLGEDEHADSSITFKEVMEAAPLGLSPTAWRSQVDRVVARSVTHLALQLQNALRDHQPTGTLLFSPLSISGALNILWLGARGRTADELASFLGVTPTLGRDALLPSYRQLSRQLANTTGTQVDFANGLFLQYGYPVRTWFANISQDTFNIDVFGVEFSADGDSVISQINGWVSNKTRNRINKFLHSPLPSNTKVLITNALYFNGEWEYPFPAVTTLWRPYTIPKAGNETPEVFKLWMMSNSGELPYTRSEELKCHVVGLPYKGKEVTMYLILPIEKGLEAFRSLEQNLTTQNMEMLHASLNETSVIVSVPRMRIQSTFHLQETIQHLGVKALFDPVEADLGNMSPGKPLGAETVSLSKPEEGNSSSNMSTVGFPDETKLEPDMAGDNPGLYVDDVIHKVEIEVTETGTVASAVTGTFVTRDSSRIVLSFNRPFLFFIRHEPTGLLMFWGSVMRPNT